MAAPRTPKPSGVLDPDFTFAVPDGDDRQRRICGHCGFVDYDNPRIVVGSVVRHEGRILLCRRAINPRKGFWTLPAGYLETGETPAEGAAREAREEANAALTISGVLAIYTIRRLGQVQIMHRAILAEPAIFAGAESLEVGLFAWKDIPWPELAFPSVVWALNHDLAVESDGAAMPFFNPAGEDGDMEHFLEEAGRKG
jgi:ADP-ribose pyrophosphatase YjhB (NUDIX family)